jgi:predicted ATPase/DNA-binding CsgD family transcriptional regulator
MGDDAYAIPLSKCYRGHIPTAREAAPIANLVLPGQGISRRRLGLLPAEATGFVGRAAELSAITTLLTSARLVTVTGPAGVGKTRVSLRAAALSADRFPDGVWLVELSGLGDPALLFSAVAAALGLPDTDDRSRQAAVLDHLRRRRLALILDTCEHLVDGCAAFAATVLRDAPEVTLLATSRQPLDAPGEHAVLVPPLRIDDEAVELFAQRSAAVLPEFEVTAANRADVVRLCRRLDGIPLAIELAAVRLRALPLTDLADRVAAGFGVLAASRRGTIERHATLRAAVEWSYDLCTAAERALWRRLSVFAGSFDVTAAEEVCSGAGAPREEIVRTLVSLVDKSVVLRCDSDENHYRLLDTLREFGAEKLAESGEDQARALDRLTARYLSLATRFEQHLLDDDQADKYRQLCREYVNIRVALEYTLGDSRLPASADDLLGRARQGAALASLLHGYWQMSGQFSEGRNWLGRALSLVTPQSPERAWALGVYGRLAAFQGDPEGAAAYIRESIRLARDLGEPLAEARGYLYLNLALSFARAHAEALTAGEAARQAMTACDDRIGLICLESQLGHAHQLAGRFGPAIECSERGLAMLGPSSGERWITSYLYLISGLALFQYPDRSTECAVATRRALAAKHDLGEVTGTASALEVLGWLAARDERFGDAAWLLGAADALWQLSASRLGNIPIMLQTHQRVVERAIAAMGERGYEAAFAQGAGMPLDDVVRRVDDASRWPPGASAADGIGPARATRRMVTPTAATLTRREREIAALVANGLSNRQIAARLFISKRTVDAHVEHIFGKLEISSRVQLTVWLQSAENAAAG